MNWLPCSLLSESEMRLPMGTLSLTLPLPFPNLRATVLEPHSVGVAVLVIALVGVALTCCDPCLAHDDHAGGAAIDAEAAPRAHVFVDDEDDVVVGIDTRLIGLHRFGDGVGRQHVDALPRADVDAALAHDALGLV